MSIIDDVLWLLQDGDWHDWQEIAKKFGLKESKAETILDFLTEYSFIQLSEDRKKVKLQPMMLKFIKEIQQLEDEEA